MFEFESHRDNPVKLLEILERFTCFWAYTLKNDEAFGVSDERLARVEMPKPLRALYQFAGSLENIFSHQDHLVPFECLETDNGKLIFAWENQGVWSIATEMAGDDPNVYVKHDDDDEYELLDSSLARFIVTFCLHEMIFGAASLSSIDDFPSKLESQKKIAIPIWLDAKYPNGPLSFYLVDGRILVMNDSWCGGKQPDMDASYPVFFPKNMHKGQQQNLERTCEFWEIPELPIFVKQQHLESLVRRHKNIADEHREKSVHYESILGRLLTEN